MNLAERHAGNSLTRRLFDSSILNFNGNEKIISKIKNNFYVGIETATVS